MTPIAPHLTAFFRERLPLQRGASPHTCESYAYSFQLLLEFASDRLNVTPSKLYLEQLDAALVMEFLAHLEAVRDNGPRTRNARLAAIKSFMRFVEHRVPSVLEQSLRILAIPSKRADIPLIRYLSMAEMQAILSAPDVRTRAGIRDRAMASCGLCGGTSSVGTDRPFAYSSDPATDPDAAGGRQGAKGAIPAALEADRWRSARLAGRARRPPAPELFLNASGRPMTRVGFTYILRKHVSSAAKTCPSLREKRVSPHVLRHSCAMMIYQATGDLRKVSLWLGHAQMQTTEIYLRADPVEKIEIIEAVTPPSLRRGRFTVPDKLIASLRGA